MGKTIRELKRWLEQEQPVLSQKMLDELLADSRVGVRKMVQSYLKEQERQQKEAARLEALWQMERKCQEKGYKTIAGVDEAGRGPLAGPVVAAAVVLPSDFDVTGLNDSKQLSAEKRNQLKRRIEQQAVSIGVGIADVEYIDKYNILQATYHAMRLALEQLTPAAEFILADAVRIPGISIPQEGIVKGDSLSHSIAAASIIAKTTRDEWMAKAAEKYPGYGFDRHMGYSTPEHLEALKKWGPSPIHRRSFAPVRDCLKSQTL
ncbi:ribonuclease HII [Paenactinomyces guangxiensis]|uniref:Ribonuclease HII n=1 Tax=Paenactinomyces guangxiensis TaxID=1490290 RepID=A0A7W1WRF4_9BACL|nr:ribonuclease HII [Paenactinomyces guangxiensis]MBA4494708.1 ribonuclease HII [Paenactinomyces guangxiensis]MBH8591792.1 ribonuclease HII [Paenactinomyces guangxiensis]